MTEAMPSLDVSAALQAAVAAAAELARVGLSSDNLVVSPEDGNHASALINLATKASEFESTRDPRSDIAGATDDLEHAQYQAILEARSSGSVSTSDQFTGQDAGGDQDQHNDMGSVTSSVDAAGEKTFEESEEDAAKRLARSRERNREHARRTRLRKKAQLEALQSKVRGLEAEKKALKQKIEECSIASILINLAEPEEPQQDETVSLLDDTMMKQAKNDTVDAAKISMLTAGKRKRFASVDNTSDENKPIQAFKLKIDGETKIIGPKSHVNWKNGIYSDEDGVQRQLTSEQLEGLRRERNRMHAKMTRDRKKNFIATIEKTIKQLERDNQKMRDVLNKVGSQEKVVAATVSPLTSPGIGVNKVEKENTETPAEAASHAFELTPAAPLPATHTAVFASFGTVFKKEFKEPPKQEPALKPEQDTPPKRQKVAHGFSLDG